MGDEQKSPAEALPICCKNTCDIPASDTGSQRAELQMQTFGPVSAQPKPAEPRKRLPRDCPPDGQDDPGCTVGSAERKGQAALIDVLKTANFPPICANTPSQCWVCPKRRPTTPHKPLQTAMHDADPGVRGTAALALGQCRELRGKPASSAPPKRRLIS